MKLGGTGRHSGCNGHARCLTMRSGRYLLLKLSCLQFRATVDTLELLTLKQCCNLSFEPWLVGIYCRRHALSASYLLIAVCYLFIQTKVVALMTIWIMLDCLNELSFVRWNCIGWVTHEHALTIERWLLVLSIPSCHNILVMKGNRWDHKSTIWGSFFVITWLLIFYLHIPIIYQHVG